VDSQDFDRLRPAKLNFRQSDQCSQVRSIAGDYGIPVFFAEENHGLFQIVDIIPLILRQIVKNSCVSVILGTSMKRRISICR
jgi:hypothetical protein